MSKVAWVHSHIEDGHREVFTDGKGYDCPKDRGCWYAVNPRRSLYLLTHFAPTKKIS